MAKVCLSLRAAVQLREIYQYSASQWGDRKAAEYIALFERCFCDLGDNELLGRVRSEVGAGCRSVSVGKHVVFYRTGGQIVTIVAVLHGSMDVVKRVHEEKVRQKDKKIRKGPPKKK